MSKKTKPFELLKEKHITSPYYIFCVLSLNIADQVYAAIEEYALKISVPFHDETTKKAYKKHKKAFAKLCKISIKELNQVLDCSDDVTVLVLSRIASAMKMFLIVDLEYYKNASEHPKYMKMYKDTLKKLGYNCED